MLLLLLLLLDLVVIDLLEEGVFPLRPEDVLGLALVDILVIHLHLVGTITSHGCIHLHLIVIVNDLSTLGVNPRLTHG